MPYQPCLIALAACLLLTLTPGELRAAREPGVTYYVATGGHDDWSGTLAAPNAGKTDGPLATLTAARDAVRKLKTKDGLPRGGVVVVVHGGVYNLPASFELTAEDSGTISRPVTYRAAAGEVVRLTGGRDLPVEGLKPLSSDAVKARLQPEVRDKVLELDLKPLGLTSLGSFPPRYRGAPAVPELFFNDERMTVAKWPNTGWAHVAKIIESGSIPRTGDTGARGGIFEYAEDAPNHWRVDEGVWLQGYWCFDWFDETIRVKAIDTATRQITLAEPTVYGVKQGNPSPRRYKAMNVLEELTSPGEYYIDRKTSTLYFYPPAALKGARMALSTLDAPVVRLTEVSNVTLRGFIIENGLGTGITVTGGSDDAVQACQVRNVRQVGIEVQGGARHKLEACDIHHTGTGGVILAGGDRKTLTPAKHEAVNCHIWRYSEHQLTYANAFLIQGVGNRVANCLIHDAPHQAIGVHGNDHLFEYNVVHHICTETDDCGAYYKGRDPSCRGNYVRYNFFHNIGSPMGHGNAAVYFDDGDGGDFVIGNVFFRCGDPGKGSFGTVFSHGGHDLLAENNIFVECKRSLGSAPWNDKRWKDYVNAELWQTRLLKDVDITKPPYTERYPALVGFMDPQPGAPRVSQARRNVICMGAAVSSGNWQVSPEENLITDKDPGFVDAAKGNFALRPDSEVFKKLPGFEPIPFEKMGLYKDELRPTLPVEKWTYPPPKPLEPLAKTVAAAQVKKANAPVFKVSPAAGPITVDGKFDPAEYRGDAMLLAKDVMGGPASRQSRAWLTYDSKALYLLIDNTVHPDTKLDGNQWGSNDAVEVALQVPREGKATPIYVLRGYGNGRVEFGSAPNGNEEPLTMDPGGIVYKALVPEKGRWVAEVSIPLNMLDLDPTVTPKVRFSLAVRKVLDDLWLMWEPTQAHSYDVSQAGYIEFTK
ncbi:MAG: right-handed parallel beta-helix repeat-containing protein [Armatimonadia bacterium]